MWYHESDFKHNDFYYEVVEHMEKMGFYIAPCCQYVSGNERTKSNIYYSLAKVFGQWIRKPLDKFFPVKFRDEYREKFVWLHMRDDQTGKICKEIRFGPNDISTPGGVFLEHDYYFDFYNGINNGNENVNSIYDVNKVLHSDPKLRHLLRKIALEELIS